ncbi:hypothetical protein I4U23_009394 [Adineta vaga]|nr:hypothetical protein I4U23_009394 [Adineta vaga]
MSIENKKFKRTDIHIPITSKQNIHTGAQGDCLYLPVISTLANRTIFDAINDKNEYKETSLNLEYITDNCFQSIIVNDEQKRNPTCYSTSSATFIVSTTSFSNPLDKIVQNDNHMINSNKNIDDGKLTEILHDQQYQISSKQYLILMITISGIILISTSIIIIAFIY